MVTVDKPQTVHGREVVYRVIHRCWCSAGEKQSPTIARLPHPTAQQEATETEFYPVFDDC